MSDEQLTSVSKGCFVVRGRKKTKQKLDAGDFLGSSKLHNRVRWKKVQETWQEMESHIRRLHLKLTSDIFTDMLHFIEKSSSVKNEIGGRHTEIPAAALITGVNMPDHASLFHQLSDDIKSSITPHVATLCAKNCSNMKALMCCIGQQLILGEASDQHNVTVEDIDTKVQESLKDFTWKRSIPLTVPLLQRWYSMAEHAIDMKTPKKRKKESFQPPVVLIIHDTEAFLPKLLQDLILMLSDFLSTLPVILIFGVATSWTSVVDRQLSHSAIVHLGLKKFYSPSASQHLSLIIDEILLNSSLPFKLGGKCMQLLLDVFLCHDFSVTNFLLLLKFCNLEHFYEEPASFLCTNDKKEMRNLVKNAPKELLQHMRSLPSLKSYLSNLGTKQKEDLERSDENFRKVILELLLGLRHYHEIFFPVMRSLFYLCKSLPRHPLGRHLRELYCACDHGPITDSDDYKQARLLLQVSSRDQLVQRLTACLNELESLPSNEERTKTQTDSLQNVVVETRKELKSAMEKLACLEELQDKEEDEENTATQDVHKLEKVKYTYQLKEKLQSRHRDKKHKKMTMFEKLRMNSIESLHQMYKKVLTPPRALPLHEVYYFDSTSTVKNHMVASPRLAIQTALSDPRYYLKQPCLDSADGMIPPSAPDLCIAYKLHNECGRIINLCDWMEAFHTIVTSQDRGKDEDVSEEVDEVTQARFIRAASELQFMGFIKPTKKKTDHVQRLTWSHS